MDIYPNPATVTVPVQAQPNPTAVLEHEIDLLKQRHKWMTISWWLMFVLLVLAGFGLAALTLWNTRDVRDESLANNATLGVRIDANSANAMKQLQAQATTSDLRIDQLLRDYADLKSDLAATQYQLNVTAQSCMDKCSSPSK